MRAESLPNPVRFNDPARRTRPKPVRNFERHSLHTRSGIKHACRSSLNERIASCRKSHGRFENVACRLVITLKSGRHRDAHTVTLPAACSGARMKRSSA